MSIATLDGHFCERVSLFVPQFGVWYADIVLIDDSEVSGQVTLTIGTADFVGTVSNYGTRGEQAFCRLTAGAGAWGTSLPARAYHNDAEIKAKLIAEDAARECGETLETLNTQAKVGVHYVRRIGAASRALEAAIGPAWHVGYDGVTRVGERPTTTPADDSYTVVDVEPDDYRVTLAMDDIASVVIGSVLSDGLDTPLTVRELEITVDAENVTVSAWCGGTSASRDRLGDAFRSLVERERAGRIFGKWRYRVSEMDGDRVKLQAISRAVGLPDVLPVSMFPGVAGVHADLTPGATVAVEFLEGDPKLPVVTGFVGRDGSGFVPVNLEFDATGEIKMGANASEFVALATKTLTELQGVKTAFDSHTHNYNPGPGALAPTAVPLVPMPSPSSVAATLVKAE